MDKIICDICKKNEANRKFKVKISRKGRYERTGYGIRWNNSIWQPYEKVDICEECGERFLGLARSLTTKDIVEMVNKATIKREK